MISPAQKGFTLVELLLVVALIAVLSSFLIPGFSNYIDNQNLRQAQELLINDLRTAQNKALTGVSASDPNVSFWGIKITSDPATNYSFFSSDENTNAACDGAVLQNTSEVLPGDAVISGANGVCVFFSLRNADASFGNFSDDTLSVGNAGETACHGVQINSAGLIRGVDLCP